MAVSAVLHVKGLRGGAQSKLLYASDGNLYVVKFQNNPQGKRVLANELLATNLARALDLPVPAFEVIHVPQELIDATPELRIDFATHSLPCLPGRQFGSRYVLPSLASGQVLDAVPRSLLPKIRNLDAFLGMLAFDIWTCNSDNRQGVFYKNHSQRKYTVAFIDHGYCFNALKWNFRDAPLWGIYGDPHVYAPVAGWDSFEPWLSRIEQLDETFLWSCAATVPLEWYEDMPGMMRLIERLAKRRRKVRDFVDDLRKWPQNPFPNWHFPMRPVSSSTCSRSQGTAQLLGELRCENLA
jgi:hypothetical protein